MKKLLIYSSILLLLGSCTKDISRFNEETKKAPVVPAATLFANGVRNVVDGITSPNVNSNVFRFTVQHWAMSTYQDEVQYDFITRAIPQRWWTIMYRDVLSDLKESARIITLNTELDPITSSVLDPLTQANRLAMVDIMEVYTYQILVTTFGNIPYSEALNLSLLFPKYDDAKTVYADLLTRLKLDISKLNVAGGGFSADQDLLAHGSVEKWIKFSNYLQVKMAMNIADVDNATAKSLVELAEAKAITSDADNIVFNYLAAPPNTNPIWVDIVQSKRQDYVAASPLLNKLQNSNDPRLPLFFKPNNANAYVGGRVGAVNTFSNVSKPNDKIAAPTFPAILADYAEMEFYRAEARERNYTIAGSAESHYNNAITASILSWGGSTTDALTYLARLDVAYTTAAGDWKQKIGTQKWIALYNRPYEGWTEIRRFDFPVLAAPINAKSGFPNRLTYPANEQQLNGANYTAASAAIGGDKVETKLFWDKF